MRARVMGVGSAGGGRGLERWGVAWFRLEGRRDGEKERRSRREEADWKSAPRGDWEPHDSRTHRGRDRVYEKKNPLISCAAPRRGRGARR